MARGDGAGEAEGSGLPFPASGDGFTDASGEAAASGSGDGSCDGSGSAEGSADGGCICAGPPAAGSPRAS
ncbi:PH domain-containing protein, partial [Streptomyces sp. NPDC024062]